MREISFYIKYNLQGLYCSFGYQIIFVRVIRRKKVVRPTWCASVLQNFKVMIFIYEKYSF